MSGSILVIDQGTTSTLAILFDASAAALASAQETFRQVSPQSGWIEHDPRTFGARRYPPHVRCFAVPEAGSATRAR